MKEYEKESILQKEKNGEIKIETEKTVFFFFFTGLLMEGPDQFSDSNKHG